MEGEIRRVEPSSGTKVVDPVTGEHEPNGEMIEINDDEEQQEVQKLKVKVSPVKPTPVEVEDHRCSHDPYRSWCKLCVMGKALGERHSETGEHAIPIIGLDYFYVSEGGVKVKAELELGDGPEVEDKIAEQRRSGALVKALIVRDHMG